MPYLVLKPIPVNDTVIPSGELVDAEGWRNLRTLISGRYLSPEPVAGKPAPKAPVVEDDAPQKAAAPVKAAKAKRTTPTSTSEE